MMRALVTGANGFIGSHVVRAFLRAGAGVRAMVQPDTPTDSIAHLPAEIVAADLTQPTTLVGLAKDCDVVVHLAALARDYGPFAAFRRVNVDGTFHLLSEARRSTVRRFVFVSSVAVHGYRDYAVADEDAPRDGHASPYGLSKILAEDHVRAAHAAGAVEGVVVRPGVAPFGPRDRTSFYDLALALERRLPLLVEGGRARFTTAYAENLAHGLWLAASHPAAAGRTYLITDERPITWRAYFEAIASALGTRLSPVSVPGRLVSLVAGPVEDAVARFAPHAAPPLTRYRARLLRHDLVFRSERAYRELGYRPEVSFEEGLRRTVEWYRRVRAGDADADRRDP